MYTRSFGTLYLKIAALCFSVALLTPGQAYAQTETILRSFGLGTGDGHNPYASMVMDSSGNLYGTTVNGGAHSDGVVYELSPPVSPSTTWTETLIHSFGGTNDGINPYGGLILYNGDFYGTTEMGGAHNKGIVYKLAESGGTWNESVLYSFAGGTTDGSEPYDGLVVDSSGNFYGTTYVGGTDNVGVVFELSGATESVLYSFAGGTSDGSHPYANLIIDSHGNLYGTTSSSGAHTFGTIFELSPGTPWTETLLWSFGATNDGQTPYAGLLVDSSGNLYGTTESGGAHGDGTVYEYSGGTETVLYSFSGSTDGKTPYAGLIIDSSGNLYGTTESGGSGTNPVGTLFELSPGVSWTKTILHNFGDTGDGTAPYGGVIMDSSGNLYGTAYSGGANGNGIVYKVT
jgi:uncharacterized repeat protein (TIGR03803 family)